MWTIEQENGPDFCNENVNKKKERKEKRKEKGNAS